MTPQQEKILMRAADHIKLALMEILKLIENPSNPEPEDDAFKVKWSKKKQ